jgi:hypothetical protein
MIIYGTRGKVVAGQQVETVCPGCGNTTHVSFGILRYFHVYWIPMFPTAKQVGVECLHCERTRIDKEIPDDLASRLRQQLMTRERVFPLFSGLALLLIGIVVLSSVAGQEEKREAEYLTHPMVHDLYVVDLKRLSPSSEADHQYGVLRVIAVARDGVIVKVGNYGYSRWTGATKAIRKGATNEPTYFSQHELRLTPETLQRLKDQSAIMAVTRP